MDDADKRPQKMSDVWLRLHFVLQDYQTSMDSASATSSSALQVNSSPSFIVSHVAFIFAAQKSVTIPDTPQVACRTSHFISRTSQVTDVQMNIEPGQNSELFLNHVEVHQRFMNTAPATAAVTTPAPAAQAVFEDSGGSFSALGAEGPTAEANVSVRLQLCPLNCNAPIDFYWRLLPLPGSQDRVAFSKLRRWETWTLSRIS